MLSLTDPITKLRLVGPTSEKALAHLGIKTVQNLLYYFPRNWQDLSKLTTISQISPQEKVNLKVKIKKLSEFRTPRRRMHITEALLEDTTGNIVAIWFNQPFLRKTLLPGRDYYMYGKADIYLSKKGKGGGTLQLQNPTYELVKEDTIHTAGIISEYELTEGLTQKQIRYFLSQAKASTAFLKDSLPEELKQKLGLLDLPAAIEHIHFPATEKKLKDALKRLAFEELFLFQLALLSFKSKLRTLPAPKFVFNSQLVKKFVGSLPFKLTNSQRLAVWEILRDLSRTYPMNRLLEGEVGSGKTVVAGIAMLEVAKAGYQSVLLAPTEILAWQHFQTLNKLYLNSGLEIALLTKSHKTSSSLVIARSETTKQSQEIAARPAAARNDDLYKKITSGQTKIIIGTHALLQESVRFNRIGLLIIDEQHRFGVRQRAALVDRGQSRTETRTNADESPHRSVSSPFESVFIPHLLSMTATPIPRTLALAFYGDLDISELRELPLGRKKVITKLVEPDKRALAYEFIRKQLQTERQVYVVTPLIEESTPSSSPPSPGSRASLHYPASHGGKVSSPTFSPSRREGGGWEGVKTAMTEFENLKTIFPEFEIKLMHGRLPGDDKKEIMQDFKSGKTQILVSTSVIEVGVDVPNATVMIIENAERFGLSQLHQLRGRVGRSTHQSFCFLFADNTSNNTKERLMAVVNSNDGFELAEKDLELRGAGEVMGTRQSGFVPFKIAKLSDRKLISMAKAEAENLLKEDENLGKYPLLKQKVEEISEHAHLE